MEITLEEARSAVEEAAALAALLLHRSRLPQVSTASRTRKRSDTAVSERVAGLSCVAATPIISCRMEPVSASARRPPCTARRGLVLRTTLEQ